MSEQSKFPPRINVAFKREEFWAATPGDLFMPADTDYWTAKYLSLKESEAIHSDLKEQVEFFRHAQNESERKRGDLVQQLADKDIRIKELEERYKKEHHDRIRHWRRVLELEAHLTECQKECEEQARLNGMGSEREAALLTRVNELELALVAEKKP